MTRLDSTAFARKNLLDTYLAIGQTFPGAEIRETDAYVALLSDLPHPSGNFAAQLNLDPWSAAELRELALTRPAFQVVALPEDAPDHLSELLRRAGFEVVQRMVTMIAAPSPSPSLEPSTIEMTRCDSPEERRKVGRFMADAFFSRETEALRDAMTESIVEATSLSVHAHIVRERLVAGATLSNDPNILGIYNLCVGGPHRGKGVGSDLVKWCLARASERDLSACLQCTPSLEPWYLRHGFVRTGAVTIWSLING